MAGNDTESTLTVVGEMDLIMASVLLSKLVHDPTDPKMSVDKLEMKLRHIYEHQIIQRALSTQSVMKTSLLNSLNGALPLDALSRLTIIRVPRRPLRAQDILREMPNPKVFLGNGGRIFVKEALLAAVREIRSQTKARALAEMQKGKGSSTYSRPPTPVADEGIGDLQFQVKVEKWHTVNTDTLEDMQGMLLEEEKFGNRVLRLFSLLTVLEVGVENPLRWWPVFLRAAARDLVIERAKLYIAKRGLVASITVSMRTGKDIAKDARLKMPAEDFEWTRILSCLLEQGTGENPVELEALDVSNLMAFGNVNDATVTVSRALSEAKERQQGFQLLLKMFKAGITRQVIHRLTKRDSEEHLGSQLKIET